MIRWLKFCQLGNGFACHRVFSLSVDEFDGTYLSTTFIYNCSFILFCFNIFPTDLSLSLSQFSHMHDGGVCDRLKKGPMNIKYQKLARMIIKIKEMNKINCESHIYIPTNWINSNWIVYHNMNGKNQQLIVYIQG